MISCRADFFEHRRKQHAPVYRVLFTIYFPQLTRNDWSRTDDGRYYANIGWAFEGPIDYSEKVNNKIVQAIAQLSDRFVDEHGQGWTEFSKDARDTFVSRLQPICEEPIHVESQSVGSYEYRLHMKVKAS